MRLFKDKTLTEKRFDLRVDQLRRLVRENVAAFKDNTAKARKERKAAAEADVLTFMETYLPHYCTAPFAEFHQELVDLANQASVTEPMAGDAPRGFAKSTIVSFGYPLHKVCYRLKKFIILGSDTETQAEGITQAMMVELEENPRLIADFGKLKGGDWTGADFTTSTGVKVMARGSGQKVRGLKNGPHRPDLIILDDMENDESVKSPTRILKVVDWVLKAVLPSLEPNKGALFIVGTLLAKKSALALLKENPKFKTFHFQSLSEDGRSLWESRFSAAHLLSIKETIGSKSFNQEYQGTPEADDADFKSEWLENFYEAGDIEGRDLVTATYGDPSSKSSAANDFKAVITVSVSSDGVYVRHAWIRKDTPAGFVGQLYDQTRDCGSVATGSEENAIGEFLTSALDLEAKERGYTLPLIGINHTSNKTARVNRLSPLAQRRKIFFIKGHSDQDLLREQLASFPTPSVNDDGPDALEGAVALAEGRAVKAAGGHGASGPGSERREHGFFGTLRRAGLGFGRRHANAS